MRLSSEHLADTQSTGVAVVATAAETRLDVRTTRGAGTGLLFSTVEKILADLTTRGAGKGLLLVLKTLAGEEDRAMRDGLEPLEDASLDTVRLGGRKETFGDNVKTPSLDVSPGPSAAVRQAKSTFWLAYCTVRDRPLLQDLAGAVRISTPALTGKTVTRRGQLEERAGEEAPSWVPTLSSSNANLIFI